MSRTKDISGRRFGMLTAIHPTEKRKRYSVIWECRCDCGNTIEASVQDLDKSDRTSCGCFRDRNLTGNRYGRLTVLKKLSPYGRARWMCQCDCGKQKAIPQDVLLSGHSKSCGACMRGGVNNPSYTHGLSHTKEYWSHKNALRRLLTSARLLTASKVHQTIKKIGNHCVYCGGAYEHLDHVTPLSQGGKHIESNIVPCCRRCNLSKAARILWKEWIPITSSYMPKELLLVSSFCK